MPRCHLAPAYLEQDDYFLNLRTGILSRNDKTFSVEFEGTKEGVCYRNLG